MESLEQFTPMELLHLVVEELALQSLDEEDHGRVDRSVDAVLLGQINYAPIDEVNFGLATLENVHTHRALVLLPTSNHLNETFKKLSFNSFGNL